MQKKDRPNFIKPRASVLMVNLGTVLGLPCGMCKSIPTPTINTRAVGDFPTLEKD